MADDTKTIQVGFANGLSVGLKLDKSEIDKLIKAIEAEEKWIEVKEEKRVINLRADRVDFYGFDAEQDDRRAGFE